MMQGFYVLAMQQARRRMRIAAAVCIAAAVSLVLAGRTLLRSPAVPVNASSLSYTVRSEQDRLIVRQNDGTVLRTAIDTRTLPAADREALRKGIVLYDADELSRLLEDYSS